MAALKNARHERFAQELAAGKPASEAYVAAGYKPSRPHASHLQHQSNVSQRVAEILAAREAAEARVTERAIEQSGIDKAWVITRLQEVAERSMQREAVTDEEGNPLGEYRFNAAGANKALELIGKELGMFIERKHIEGSLTVNDERSETDAKLRDIFGATAGIADEPAGGGKVVH